MNIKRKKAIFEIVLCAVLAVLTAFAAVSLIKSKDVALAEGASVSGETLNDYYFVNDELSIPTTAEIASDGETYNGSFAAIIAPDGKTTDNAELILGRKGEYKIVYVFEKNGKKYKTERKIKVVEKNWEVGSSQSSVEFGDIGSDADGETTKGLALTLAAGDAFKFNEPLRLDDGSVTQVVKMFSAAVKAKQDQIDARTDGSVAPKFEAGFINVTLTDCYDPSVYVTMLIWVSRLDGEGVYARVKASGQGDFGLYIDCPFPKRNVYIDGKRYGVYSGDYGQSLTLDGRTFSLKKQFGWSIDAKKGNVYIAGSGSGGESNYLIDQLYNEDVGGTVFPGFTTGEAYVSISTSDAYADAAYFEIEEICGKRGEELVSGKYEDKIAPTVVVDTDGRGNEFYLSRGTRFRLFDATAYDPNLVGDVKTKVYYNYGTESQSAVEIRNNSFVPVRRGTYVVEYSARDSFGNVGISKIYVYVTDGNVMTLNYEKIGSMTAGEKTTLPKYTATSLNGGVKVEISAFYGDKEVKIDSETRTFIPLSVGTWKIRYTCKDTLLTYEESYEVECHPNSRGFDREPIFNKYYVKGVTYELPEIKAYEFKGAEPTEMPYEAFVSFDGGEYAKVENVDRFVVDGNASMRVKYVSGEAEYISDEIGIVDAGYFGSLDMTKYFKGEYVATADYSYIDFKSTKKTGDNSLAFINPLLTANFRIIYSFPSETMGANSYSVVLTDKNDPRIKTALTFTDRNGKSTVSVNGGEAIELSERINDGNERTIYFNAESGAFVYSSQLQTVTIPSDRDASGFVYAEVILHGSTENTVVRITGVQNQSFGNAESDRDEPQIYGGNSYGSVKINAKGVIAKGMVSDALSPVLSADVLVSVRNPNGGYAVSDDGIMLKDVPANREYAITYDIYGRYRVTYTAKDAAGNSSRQPYIVEVMDMVAPTVRFTDGSTEDTVQTIRAFYKYKVKSYEATDNPDSHENLSVYTFIYDASGVIVRYGFDKFSLTEEGDYTVYVYCVDKAGNYGYASYKLKVVA